MTHCAKCGAELIGTRKFCTACGAPAGDPRSPVASTGMTPASPGSAPATSGAAGPPSSSNPSIQYAPAPVSQVNPFAVTAGPKNMPVVTASDYGPPLAGPPLSVPMELATTTPGVGDPIKGPQVSPLAVSNVDSKRGAELDAIVRSARSSSPSAPDSSPSGIKRGVPGTQIMPSMANPSFAPGGAPSSGPADAPSAAPKRPGGTQVLGVFPGLPSRPGGPVPSSVAPSALARPASNPDIPPHSPAPMQHMGPGVPLPSQQGWNPAPAPPPPPPPYAPAAPVYAPAMPPPQPPPPPQQPPPPPPGYGYGFAYAPGSRVTVTWSNGQRYPGTVTQVTGNQCLVVFPDGQHHWVEMQYVAPS